MTVGQLRELLANYPDETQVITDMHSEYASIVEVEKISVFENGGYYSKVYRDTDKVKEFEAVCLSPTGHLDMQRCPECEGKGEVPDAPNRMLDGHPYIAPCEECGGSGYKRVNL